VHVDAVSDLKRIVTHAARIAYAVLGKVHERIEDESTEGYGSPRVPPSSSEPRRVPRPGARERGHR
jgi:hypothetical protein